MDYKAMISLIKTILGGIIHVVKGFVVETIINLIHPLAIFNTAFTVIGFLISSGLLKLNNYSFVIPLLNGPVFWPLLAISAPIATLYYLDKVSGYNKSFKYVGIGGLAISSTYIFVFSYVMGVVSLWGAISIAESGNDTLRPILIAFSLSVLSINWILKELIKDIDGKSGAVSQLTEYFYKRSPAFKEADTKFIAWQMSLIIKIRKHR